MKSNRLKSIIENTNIGEVTIGLLKKREASMHSILMVAF